MSRKIGRNDPCWCGSTYPDGRPKKYKNCHLDRQMQPEKTMGEILSGYGSAFGKKYCLHANAGIDCSSEIIKAHSIQRNGTSGLSSIARDGHVYTFLTDTAQMIKTGQFSATLIGIGKASTFTGFCGHHDSITFEPIEKHSFTGTEEQIFLLAYRTVCREMFYKRAMAEHSPALRDMDQGVNYQKQLFIQMTADSHDAGVAASLRELGQTKAIYDSALRKQDYSQIRYYMVTTDKTPSVVTSGLFQPEYDFEGNLLQDLNDLDLLLDDISLNILPTDKGGVVLLAWMEQSNVSERLARSLAALQSDALPDATLRLAIEFLENTFIEPNWWEQLSGHDKQHLLKRSRSGTSQFGDWRKPNCIMEDGVRIANWTVLSRFTNAW